jgi:putative ABC transport system permease protein
LRKVLGARRNQLVMQFLGESLLIAGLAMLIALALVELGLPWFSAFLDADLEVHYLGAGGILLPVVGLFLLVGLAGGLYPAFYLSRYQPAAVLKANQSTAEPLGTGRLRNLLVVGQFAVSIGLIICTMVVYAQTRFAQTTDLGFEREGLIQIGEMNRAQVIPQTETLMRELARVDGVEGVAGSTITIASDSVFNTNVRVPGSTEPLLIGNTASIPISSGRCGCGCLPGARSRGATPTTSSPSPMRAMESSRRSRPWRRAASTSSSTGSPPSGSASPTPRPRSAAR